MSANCTATNSHAGVSRREFLRWGAAGAAGLEFSLRGQPAQAASARARCDSVILLWMQGGVSHLDTFDPKPDAPADIRGPFKAISTNVPGIQLCEHLPRMARMADKIAFIRSMRHAEGGHERGRSLMLDGWQRLRGACLSSNGVSDHGSSAAFNVDAEPEKLREAYGDAALGRKCLAARRLVEAGARFVAVEEDGWDHHFRVFDALKNRLPALDRAVSALLSDLAGRGLLDRTLVVFATEFGRSPRINNEAGREHHQGAFSCFLAGGGIRGGQIVGASDARGESPASQPVTPDDLFGIIAAQLGHTSQPPGAMPA
ncbi:MAG: DUF1501 domain-containing protein [Verrucomicrobia bacterium]|nr:DUF1501 domain-containing protein [Verrucomicrobiota bacterium]